MIKKTSRQIEGLAWTGLGVALCVGSFRLGLGTLQSPGTGFASFLGGGLLGVFGLILTFYSRMEKSSPPEIAQGIFSCEKLKQPLLALVVLFSYPLLLKVFGFILSTFLFLFFLFKAMEPRKWFTLVVISLGGSLACYLVFQVWLRVSFPKGVLGIG
jgi:cellulose synthase/poly-beta-1,6-N-acetylglucosamine synthase-like glycosyltransferase